MGRTRCAAFALNNLHLCSTIDTTMLILKLKLSQLMMGCQKDIEEDTKQGGNYLLLKGHKEGLKPFEKLPKIQVNRVPCKQFQIFINK